MQYFICKYSQWLCQLWQYNAYVNAITTHDCQLAD